MLLLNKSLSCSAVAKLILTILLFSSQYSYAELRDPSQPLNYNPVSVDNRVKGITLQSILFSKERRIAVINDQLMEEQDQLGDITLKRIYADKIVVRQDGKERVLTLTQTIKKQVKTGGALAK